MKSRHAVGLSLWLQLVAVAVMATMFCGCQLRPLVREKQAEPPRGSDIEELMDNAEGWRIPEPEDRQVQRGPPTDVQRLQKKLKHKARMGWSLKHPDRLPFGAIWVGAYDEQERRHGWWTGYQRHFGQPTTRFYRYVHGDLKEVAKELPRHD